MNNIAYLSLGSNMGIREQFLKEAVKALKETNSIQIEGISSIYETDPVGYEDQAQFLNIAVELRTDLSAMALLDCCLEIEKELGRKREFRWGPRVIDLDVLLYNEEVIDLEKLQVPHPRMHERAFVLIPLVEITPNLLVPQTKETYSSILHGLIDKDGVHQWKKVESLMDFLS